MKPYKNAARVTPNFLLFWSISGGIDCSQASRACESTEVDFIRNEGNLFNNSGTALKKSANLRCAVIGRYALQKSSAFFQRSSVKVTF